MAIDYNITHEAFTQSQIFKNILTAGTKVASFLQQMEFVNDQQAKTATNLINNWSKVCEGFADYYNESIEDITEYLVKAKAMLDIALNAKLDEISAETLHNYFWELLSLIDTIDSVFEDLR